MRSTRIYTKTILLTLLLITIGFGLKSQKLLPTPSVDSILNPVEIENSSEYPRGGTNWYVFSDRERNPIYNSANATSGVASRADFLEMFNVTEETTDFVKVVRPGSPSSPLGWMPKKKSGVTFKMR